MGNLSFFDNMLENKLKNLHTAYLAKVISTNGTTAKIQPLGLVKAYGENAQAQSPLSNVPIAVQKIKNGDNSVNVVSDIAMEIVKEGDTIKDVKLTVTKSNISIPQISNIAAGDIVICVCCERDITEAKNGRNSTPAIGHHSMSDSVIVGCL